MNKCVTYTYIIIFILIGYSGCSDIPDPISSPTDDDDNFDVTVKELENLLDEEDKFDSIKTNLESIIEEDEISPDAVDIKTGFQESQPVAIPPQPYQPPVTQPYQPPVNHPYEPQIPVAVPIPPQQPHYGPYQPPQTQHGPYPPHLASQFIPRPRPPPPTIPVPQHPGPQPSQGYQPTQTLYPEPQPFPPIPTIPQQQQIQQIQLPIPTIRQQQPIQQIQLPIPTIRQPYTPPQPIPVGIPVPQQRYQPPQPIPQQPIHQQPIHPPPPVTIPVQQYPGPLPLPAQPIPTLIPPPPRRFPPIQPIHPPPLPTIHQPIPIPRPTIRQPYTPTQPIQQQYGTGYPIPYQPTPEPDQFRPREPIRLTTHEPPRFRPRQQYQQYVRIPIRNFDYEQKSKDIKEKYDNPIGLIPELSGTYFYGLDAQDNFFIMNGEHLKFIFEKRSLIKIKFLVQVIEIVFRGRCMWKQKPGEEKAVSMIFNKDSKILYIYTKKEVNSFLISGRNWTQKKFEIPENLSLFKIDETGKEVELSDEEYSIEITRNKVFKFSINSDVKCIKVMRSGLIVWQNYSDDICLLNVTIIAFRRTLLFFKKYLHLYILDGGKWNLEKVKNI